MAIEQKDSLATHIFHSAGRKLGRHVKALIPKADKVSAGTKIVLVKTLEYRHITIIVWPELMVLCKLGSLEI